MPFSYWPLSPCCPCWGPAARGKRPCQSPPPWVRTANAQDILTFKHTQQALLGTYNWRRLHLGGMEEVCADSPHPLDCQDLLPLLDARQTTVQLQFAKPPDDPLSVRCWSDQQWGNPLADSQEVTITGDTLSLRPGGWIYEVTARWGGEWGPGGEAHYAFYAMGPDSPAQS